jgi:flagellar M-ring protein FliF
VAEQAKADGMKQLQLFIGGLSLKQRTTIVGGSLLVALTLWFFVRFLAAPDFKVLYSGLKPADVQSIAGKLAEKSIAYEIAPDGTSLSVAADQLDRARMETASQGLPKNARMGFELFDTPNWMGTDFTEKVNYQRALEGELERTIQSLGEVEAVRVHLVMPSESLFTEREREGKAAVIIKAQRHLPAEKQFAIAQLVASAVDNIRPENVTVVDADSARPMQKQEDVAGAGTLSDHLSQQLVATLEPVVGEGHVRATVRVEYDSSSFEDTQETYDPKSTVATSVQRTEENAGSSGAGGIPGTASNVPPTQKPAVIASNSERNSARSESSTFVVNKQVRHMVQPAGRLRRITAAVIVDDVVAADAKGEQRRKRTPEEMKNLEVLASAAVGLDPQRGDLIAVENLSFQSLPEEPVHAPALPEKIRVQVNQWSGALRYIAIGMLFLVVYLIILRPVKKQVLAAFRELPKKISSSVQGALSTQAVTEVLPAEGSVAGLRKQLVDRVKGEPATATKLVQSWIRESGQ